VSETNPQPEATILTSYLKSLDVHKDTRWFWPNGLRPTDINTPSELDAWCHYVHTHLTERAGVTGHQSRAWEFKGQDLKANSVISPTSGGLSTK
jgi:hypothetical protein